MTTETAASRVVMCSSPRPALRVLALVCGVAAGIYGWPLLMLTETRFGLEGRVGPAAAVTEALLFTVGVLAAARELNGPWARRVAGQAALVLISLSAGTVFDRFLPLKAHPGSLAQTPPRIVLAAAALCVGTWLLAFGDGLGTGHRPLSIGQAVAPSAATWGMVILALALAVPAAERLTQAVLATHHFVHLEDPSVVLRRGVLRLLVLTIGALVSGLGRRDLLMLLGASIAAAPIFRVLLLVGLHAPHWSALAHAEELKVSGVLAAAGMAIGLLAAHLRRATPVAAAS